MLGACQKGEPLQEFDQRATIRLNLQGYIMQDTLEFIKDGKLFCEAEATNFKMIGSPGQRVVVSASDLYVRKKGSTEFIDTIALNADKFEQMLRLFYDGQVLTNNIELTPVSSPDMYGLRFSWIRDPIFNKKTAVDIEILIKSTITDPIDYSYTFEYKHQTLLKNIDKDFGEFIELPKIENSDPFISKRYVYKVFEAGTKNYPFTPEIDFYSPIEESYANLRLVAGESHLIQIKPSFSDNYFYLYETMDIAEYFRQ